MSGILAGRASRSPAALSQIGGAVKQPLVGAQCITVGHARQIVAHMPRFRGHAHAGNAVHPVVALHFRRHLHITVEKIGDDLRSAGADAHDVRVPVDMGKEQLLDLPVRLGHLGRKGRDSKIRGPDVGSPLRLQPGKILLRHADHILNHVGDLPPHDLVGETLLVENRIFRAHLRHQAAEEWHLLQHFKAEITGTQTVIDVMGIVGDVVGNCRHLRLEAGIAADLEILQLAIFEDGQRNRTFYALALRIHQRAIVLDEAFQRFPGQVDAVIFGITALQLGDDAQRLGVMVEAAIGQQHRIQRVFAGMAEGRVAEIMHQRHALGQILIQLQRTGERAGDLRHLDGVGETRAIMVAIGADEDLRFVLQAAKGCRVDDPVTVPLELGTRQASLFGKKTSARRPWIRGEDRPLPTSETQCALVYDHASTCYFPRPRRPFGPGH
ncbi:hypothetical protein AT6N2_C0560 [Agrobacterium tumefaciens]|nr:hypothetical protein AT6N2_C0560 [Agrobacterium tumefaciens]